VRIVLKVKSVLRVKKLKNWDDLLQIYKTRGIASYIPHGFGGALPLLITMTNAEAINHISECKQSFEQNFENDYLNIVETFFDYDRVVNGPMPQYRVRVVIEDEWRSQYESTYTYPVAEFGRDLGLFLFDTVTHWEEEEVELRLGYEPEETQS